MTDLAEQYVYESELHLAHLDALIARAARVPVEGEAQADMQALARRMQRDRDRLAGELDELRRFPAAPLQTQENRQGVFEIVGLQLEKVLGAVLAHGKRKRSAAR